MEHPQKIAQNHRMDFMSFWGGDVMSDNEQARIIADNYANWDDWQIANEGDKEVILSSRAAFAYVLHDAVVYCFSSAKLELVPKKQKAIDKYREVIKHIAEQHAISHDGSIEIFIAPTKNHEMHCYCMAMTIGPDKAGYGEDRAHDLQNLIDCFNDPDYDEAKAPVYPVEPNKFWDDFDAWADDFDDWAKRKSEYKKQNESWRDDQHLEQN